MTCMATCISQLLPIKARWLICTVIMKSAGYTSIGKITPEQTKVHLSNRRLQFSNVLFSMMILFCFVNISHFLDPVASILSKTNLLIDRWLQLSAFYTSEKKKTQKREAVCPKSYRKAEKQPQEWIPPLLGQSQVI